MHHIKSIVLLVFIALLSACGSSSSSSGGGASNDVTKIVAFGDSIGARSPNWPSGVNGATGVPVSNYSRDSQTTSNFVGRTASILEQEQPSHLLILLGTNDARQGNVGGAVANLQSMANTASSMGVSVVIGTIPPNLQSSTANANAAAISDGIRGLSNARIVDVRSAMGSGEGLFVDGLHPNAAGTAIITSTFVGGL